jgi:phosphate uptake regulator
MQQKTGEESDLIKRKVQLTGGSTYTVSIPKGWANAQEIESGSSVHMHPFDDRLIIVQPDGDGSTWRARINIEAAGEEDLAKQIWAAYAAGSDEIVVESETRLSTSGRRVASQAITELVGMEITTETEQALTARTLLDAEEVSLAEIIEQIRGIALSMHENAVDAVVTNGDETNPDHIIARDDEVDRLFGLVSRQFYRHLDNICGADQLDVESRNVFTQFRIARQLERIADHAERIAAVADKQTEPPAPEIGSEFESLATDARRVVRKALDGNTGEAMLRRDDVVDQLDDLDSQLYNNHYENVYLYGRVLASIRRTADCGSNISEISTLSDIVEPS